MGGVSVASIFYLGSGKGGWEEGQEEMEGGEEREAPWRGRREEREEEGTYKNEVENNRAT